MKKTNAKNSRLAMWLLALGIMAFVSNENATAQQLQVVKDPKLGSVLSQSKKTLSKPKPLTPAQKILVVQQILGDKGQKVSSLTNPITLGVTNLSVKNRANLELFKPKRVMGWEGGEATFSGGEGSLSVEFTAPSVGKYLIDLGILTAPETKFTLTGNSNILTMAGSSGKSQHNLSFIMEAKQANENVYFQLAGDIFWIFFSCEISQIK